MNVLSGNRPHRRTHKYIVMAVCTALTTFAWGQSVTVSNFTNRGSILNTRHNMTQSTLTNGYDHTMDNGRNDYGEVCVYCHTPHGANTTIAVPLWNRTIKTTAYQTYNQLATGSFSVAPGTSMQPGAQSLSCLSCHDGQTAIDSIINMPGSGRYSASQQTSPAGVNIASPEYIAATAFMNTWNNAGSGVPRAGAIDTVRHQGMNSTYTALGGAKGLGNGDGSDGIGCLVCHSDSGLLGGADHDMRSALIGTDLRNDHPIGVRFPLTNGPGTDWKTPTAAGIISFFESTTGPSGLDKTDIRLYQTAGEARVECASCHDPHGVPSAGVGSTFIPLFLRVDNKGSKVCFKIGRASCRERV